jgi:SAM-dependent methyltransferase
MPEVWNSGSAYELYVGRWSRPVAGAFIEWLDVAPNAAWLDVGCGTGALSEAIAAGAAPSRIEGVDPSSAFLLEAATRLHAPIFSFRVGSASRLPYPDSTFDVVASALVLTFLPDASQGVREMVRVTTPGGTVASYVWDYAGEMQMMKYFWDVAAELFQSARDAHEGLRFELARPEALVALFGDAGLLEVDTTPLEIRTRFADFDDYWQPFLGGQGPAPGYVTTLGKGERDRLRDALEERLPVADDGSIDLLARAWGVKGRRAG